MCLRRGDPDTFYYEKLKGRDMFQMSPLLYRDAEDRGYRRQGGKVQEKVRQEDSVKKDGDKVILKPA